jgi:hypothetical protein
MRTSRYAELTLFKSGLRIWRQCAEMIAKITRAEAQRRSGIFCQQISAAQRLCAKLLSGGSFITEKEAARSKS